MDVEEGQGGQGKKGASKEYIVVGTAYAVDGEQEPNKGRILVFEVTDKPLAEGKPAAELLAAEQHAPSPGRRLTLVAEKQTRGAVYSLNAFIGKLLAGINSKVKLFAFADKGPDESELVSKCGHNEHLLALMVESRGDFIVVADLMKSITLLVYRGVDDTIEEIARDYNANWMTAVGILDDDTYIGAENHLNLFTVQKNSEAATEEARHMLKVVGEYHLGEFVNKMRHGSLVMQDANAATAAGGAKQAQEEAGQAQEPDKAEAAGDAETLAQILSSTPKPQMVFGTVNGVIGVVAQLKESQYKLLKRLERALAEVIQGVGGLSHAAWRSFSNDRKTVPSKGFVDGDLIEAFLDLDAADAEQVLQRVNGKIAMQVDEDISSILNAGCGGAAVADALTLNLDLDMLTRFVEDLARLH